MKTVLITGISKGIGKALALKYLSEGYSVLGTSTNGEVDFSDKNLKVFCLDLSISQSIKDCVAEISKLGVKIDILHNNAGVLLDENETVVIADILRKTLEVNLIGAADFTEKVIPILNVNSHIVFTSSSAGSLSEISTESHHAGYYPAYKISKCALNMYMRTLSLRLKDKIKVSSVHPGWVKTDMGGEGAPVTPEEAAKYIFETATKENIETGQFWFNGEKFGW
jgi:NAD(P)-dependent dehydrogenase (short-subunit alcohol dehydrogenase family)